MALSVIGKLFYIAKKRIIFDIANFLVKADCWWALFVDIGNLQ